MGELIMYLTYWVKIIYNKYKKYKEHFKYIF